MKKIIATLALAVVGTVGISAQNFEKGDIVMDVNLGIGADRTSDTHLNGQGQRNTRKTNKVSFTQRIGVEFGIFDIDEKSSLGIGVDLQNSSAWSSHAVNGSYNYSYEVTKWVLGDNSTWIRDEVNRVERNGMGSAIADAVIEDFSISLRLAYHYAFTDKLDTYAAIGFGLSHVKCYYSNYKDYRGFEYEAKFLDEKQADPTQLTYNYNDIDNANWKSEAMARVNLSLLVGARYYLTDHWALNAELGLPMMSFKGGNNHYNIFSFGASYKF